MFEPPTSVAVTVVIAVPVVTGVTTTVEFDTTTAATVGADEVAANVSGSSSGSANAPDTSTDAATPLEASGSPGSVPTGTGARFGTVSSNVCSARRPPGSSAVTVTSTVPGHTADTRTDEPVADAVATNASDDLASNVSGSSSGSANAPDTATDRTPPARNVTAGKRPTGTGARFGTVASNVCVACNPPGSSAVTVTVAVPPETGVTDTSEPDTDTVATAVADDVASYVSRSSSGSRNALDTSTDVAPASTRSDRAGAGPPPREPGSLPSPRTSGWPSCSSRRRPSP